MGKGVIIYQSKYGATKKYVDWIYKETNFDLVETHKATLTKISQYETIILCGGIYASGIAGLSFLKKNIAKINGKKIVVFCVWASPYDENALCEIKEHNFKGQLEEIPLFYGRGAWNEDSMTLKDKTLCKLLQKAIGKKDPNTYEPWMKALMCAVDQKCDWTDDKYLKSLLEYLGE